jgi:hypothetical protein
MDELRSGLEKVLPKQGCQQNQDFCDHSLIIQLLFPVFNKIGLVTDPLTHSSQPGHQEVWIITAALQVVM